MSLSARKNSEANLVSRIMIEVGLPLKKRIVKEVNSKGVRMNQLIANILAQHFGEPDLAFIPRNPRGPKPRAVAIQR